MSEIVNFDEKTKVLTLRDIQGDITVESKYRVFNNKLQSESMGGTGTGEFTNVEYFNEFTLGDLYTIAQLCGDFDVDNYLLGTYRMNMKIEYKGVLGD